MKSQAKQWADHLTLQGASADSLPILGILPATETVTHPDYAIAYYADQSILIWAKGEGFAVLDENKTYHRETIEHLARCLGRTSQAQRGPMVRHCACDGDLRRGYVWIDGICWGIDGQFLGV